MNHHFYLLLFSLICGYTKIMERDESAVSKNDLVNTMVANQAFIEASLVELAKSGEHGAGLDFREVKKKYLKEWRQIKLKMRAELGMKVAAVVQGKDPEEFIKNRNSAIALA